MQRRLREVQRAPVTGERCSSIRTDPMGLAISIFMSLRGRQPIRQVSAGGVMKRIVAGACLGLTLMLSSVTPAAAQAGGVNLDVGYQFLRTDERSSPVGVTTDVGIGLARHFALVGEVGWSRHAAHQFG